MKSNRGAAPSSEDDRTRATQRLHVANANVAMIARTLIYLPIVQSFKRSLVDWLSAQCWLMGFSLNVLILGPLTSHGQDTWQGPTTDASWFTGGNWTLGSPPTADQNALIDNGTTAQFANGTTLMNNLAVGTSVAGSTLQVLSGTLTVNSLLIGTDGTIRFSGGTIDIITAPIENDGTIIFDGSPDEGSGVDIVGSGKLVMNLTGTLFVAANNSYSGETLLIAGTLQANSTTALSPNSAFIVDSSAILDLDGNRLKQQRNSGDIHSWSRQHRYDVCRDN